MIGRPKIPRKICHCPTATYFKPQGIPHQALESICLDADELEAVRLKDFLGYNQRRSAKEMKVSQPTLARILKSARQKIASCLIEGKAVKLDNSNKK